MSKLRPSLRDCARLDPPLNDAEWQVAQALDALDDSWTAYVRPRLGQDVPNFVVLHDRLGVCAIAVHDWEPGQHRQADDGSIERLGDAGRWHSTVDTPRYEAARFRSTIYEHFYALTDDDDLPTNSVRSVVVLPNYSTEHARRLLRRPQISDEEHDVMVHGGDNVEQMLLQILQGGGAPTPRAASMHRLRKQLVQSYPVDDQLTPAVLSDDAANLAANPSDAALRRVRGPAGSGKSFGLAARAARLASAGKSVLVLSYNLTLSHFLRTLAEQRCREYGADPTLVTTVNFHSFCQRVVDDAEVVGLPLTASLLDEWPDRVVDKAQQAFRLGFVRRFDAVLVDEGQDFNLEWWNMLREHVVADDGEMLLVADPTQDVYGQRAWTDTGTMSGSGFSGPWTQFTGSYRLPSDLLEIANEFATRYLGDDRLAGTFSPDRVDISGFSVATRRHWTNIDRPSVLGREIGIEVVRLLDEHPDLSPDDIVFLCEEHRDGMEAVEVIEDAGYQVHHIFSWDKHSRSRRKRRFWPDAPGVKGCTVHSFKGWESSAIVAGIGGREHSRRLAYVAMTRVRISESEPSVLSIVNSDPDIADFQDTFDRWSTPLPEERLA